ncbi:hypothetical protein LEP1GSC175_2869 [Leptospira santarosai str. HAI821]|uniref:Uncharacterized protein n=1 Tax=Leptospira santarosai serovar Shermani str. LT 821 TaxID=758847 RepID=K8XVB9_9LEPT|nr:hypothetical protein LSS_17979 [Leptospira santarosai serovar Shermani str. LT 821]EMO31909.1 hypothetical protein LEP1GSC175_2869 [Leptospira santarosai str. HAI821]
MENDSDFLTRTHVNLNKDKKFFSKIIECGNSYGDFPRKRVIYGVLTFCFWVLRQAF